MTQPYDSVISEAELINIYSQSIQEFNVSDIIIKTHPRDNIDYKSFFPEAEVFTKQVPIELLNFLNIQFEYAITISSTAIYSITAKNRIILGWEANPTLKKLFGHLKI